MKLWIDDVRPAPEGYVLCKSVEAARALIVILSRGVEAYQYMIEHPEHMTRVGLTPIKENIQKQIDKMTIELIDIDHDAGEYAKYGGDYIRLLDWLEETGRNYPIRIHSMNPVGVENMRRIIQRNGWKEVF
jgi:hypothetical protein